MLQSVGSQACSFAMQSVTDTKDTLILVCIGILEALDRLQERLHLPTSVVKDLKRKLSKMVDRSLVRSVNSPSGQKLKKAELVGDAIATSDLWSLTGVEEITNLVHWAIAVTKSVSHVLVSTTLGVCHRIFILIMNLPGVPTACTLFYRIYQLVEETVSFVSSSNTKHSSTPPKGAHLHAPYIGDPSLTAVVLEYREKDCVVPWNINRRIQRVMHFQIPLRSFEATVRLPPNQTDGPTSAEVLEDGVPEDPTGVTSTSPRSIPISPLARKRVQLAFANFSDDVLYQARDRLRQQRAATVTGERDIRIPRFNFQDCGEEIYLSCGRHCATKVGGGLYRSVRASVPIPLNRYIYYEMTIEEALGIRHSQAVYKADDNVDNAVPAASEVSICIGLSTRGMALNTLVGTSKHSVGFYSAGHVLISSQRRNVLSVDYRYDVNNTVGVLVHVEKVDSEPSSTMKAVVRFCIDGVAVRDTSDDVLVVSLPFPAEAELYPTLTLRSQGVQVLGRFSVPDIVSINAEDFQLPRARNLPDIWCLDGLPIDAGE